jgi:hypothetical protein
MEIKHCFASPKCKALLESALEPIWSDSFTNRFT